ncbi:trypsin CFT-1-like [Leptidea sinapis]|uniref:trypsin CFT-1-like n=1 Tax=Leptidea sinapis TaxID=189913 RepID=UPI002141A344|nr:trypsin CFT-1-like [Leptidea sinapis]
MDSLVIALLLISSVAAVPSSRISNGASVDISSFPFAAVLLRESLFGNFVQSCVGSIVNNRCILTSANCFYYDLPSQWSVRLGSSYASSGGTIYSVAQLIGHPQFDVIGSDNDVGLMRLSSAIVYGTNVQRVSIAGTNYIVGDNVGVTIVGWGATGFGLPKSERLQRGNLITVNQQTCRSNYNLIGMTVTNNMQCAGAGSILGADFCDGDIGAPLLHNNVLAGIASWRTPICGLAYYPGIFTRVNIYSNWIVANA